MFDLSGTGQYANNTSATIGPQAVPLTIAARVRPDALTGEQAIVSIRNTVNSHAFNLVINLTAGKFSAVTYDGTNRAAASTSVLNAGQEYAVVATFTSATRRDIWVDGVNEANNTTSATPTGTINSIGIGCYSNFVASLLLNGRVGDVGLWNVVLDSAEIAAYAKGVTCDNIRRVALKHHYRCIRPASAEPDLAGAAPLTVTGSPAFADHGNLRFPRRKGLVTRPPIVAVAGGGVVYGSPLVGVGVFV